MKYFLFFVLVLITIVTITLFFYARYRLKAYISLHAVPYEKEFADGTQPITEFATNKDNQKIAYWYLPVENAKAVVILVHGYRNPGGKRLMIGQAEYLKAAGYSTVLVDLRAHDESEGNKIFLATKEWQDVEAVYDVIKAKPENVDKKIGYLGISMGASTVLTAQGKTEKGDFVVASVPFKHPDSLFSRQAISQGFQPWLIVPFLKVAALFELGFDYSNNTPSSVIKNIHVPILLVAAQRDDQVHSQDARDLFEQANEPKELWDVNSEHDVFYFYPEEFKQKVLGFLEKNVSNK